MSLCCTRVAGPWRIGSWATPSDGELGGLDRRAGADSGWGRMTARLVCAAALAAVLLLIARPSVPDEGAASNAGKALRGALASPLEACPESRLEHHELARYYPVASPMPVWVDDSGPLPRARRLRAALEHAEDEGLSPDRYELRGLEARWQATVPAEQACLDLLLTTAFARWGRDLAMGQLAPREADPTWHVRGPDFDPVAAVRAVPPESDVASQLERLVPSHGLYRRLRTALAYYRRLAAQGGWNTTLAGPRLGPGDEGERVAALRSRLHREGDLEPDDSALDRQYGEVLADAVRRFQRRHGLLVDGIAGPRTLAALNTPVAERVAQLRRAMERLRWMARALGDHYVLVNTAGFELAVVEGERTMLGMRVVVGTPGQATPSFTAMLRSLVINPYWNVPARIARDKLLPREWRNPDYLAAHGFRVLDPRTGQWRAPDATSLAEVQAGDRKSTPRLRQEPGPANLMGRLSFILPNAFDIFLHDTPDRSLFEADWPCRSTRCLPA